MANGKLTRRRALVLGAAVAVVAAAVGGTAVAALSGSVKSYTGCLVTGSGNLTKVNEGDSPLGGACSTGSVPIRLSGGDITGISVGPGLKGGGDNGDVSIQLDSKFSLPQACDAGQLPKWNGTAWDCGSETKYTAGTGLSLDGTEFSVDPRFAPHCTGNDQMPISSAFGWGCVNTFTGQSCPDGQFMRGFDNFGRLYCGQLPSIQAYHASKEFVGVAGTTTIISKALPAGKYVLFAQVDLLNSDWPFDDALAECDLAGTKISQFLAEDGSPADYAAITTAISHPGGDVKLTCTETRTDNLPGNFDVKDAELTAIRVDSIG